MRSPSSALSTIILTYNEELTLPGCLESLKGLPGEIFVVDSGSQDRTIELAHNAGTSVYSHPFTNYSSQRNWALEELPIHTAWVLNLDASERLTEKLKDEILKTLEGASSQVNGYFLRRRTLFMGRWIRFGGHYPSYQLRLFRRGKGHSEDRLYDQHFVVEGPVEFLKNDFIDTVSEDINTWTERHLSWAMLEARELSEKGGSGRQVQARLFGNAVERRRWLRRRPFAACPLFLRAFLYWFVRYFLLLGFLDGREGLIFHFLQGLWYRFMVDVKFYEMQKAAPHDGEPMSATPELRPIKRPSEANEIRSI